MTKKFELLYSYKHCRSETVYSSGFVNSEEDAIEWAREKNSDTLVPVSPPEKDPICSCEVSYCPMKFQRPWFSYRAV
jgi:translation initiation factor IF-3